MKNTIKLYFGFILLLGLISCTNNNDVENLQTQLDDKIKEVHQELQTKINYDVPSLSVYTISPKGRFFSSVKGKNGDLVTENTNFRFASNTKNFTATAILKMMQDGWLNIDDLITANIPGTNIAYTPNTSDWDFPNKQSISILQLLQHNAGVYDLTNDTSQLSYNVEGEVMAYEEYILNANPNHQFSTSEYINVLTHNNLTYGLPNEHYHYSNTGYSILGEIIRRIYSIKKGTDKTLADYLNDYIIGPNTKVPLQIRFPEIATDQQMPSPYIKGFILEDNKQEITEKKNVSGKIAEGNGIGSMKDLATYIRSLMKAESVLNAQSVELMKNKKGPATTLADNNYALGCFHLENVGYGHNGATEGYLSLMMHDPQTDVTTIVLLPFWDLRNGGQHFKECMLAMNKAGVESKKILGY